MSGLHAEILIPLGLVFLILKKFNFHQKALRYDN